jgi:amino-acid N-acetyltransferase
MRAIREGESRGLRALYLLTTTAEHYFPRFGFTRVDRSAVPADIRATEEFRSACPASATVMARPLSPGI